MGRRSTSVTGVRCAAVPVMVPVALTVVEPGGNGVIEPGELATISPSWANGTATAVAATGSAVSFTAPAPGTYSIVNNDADYGTVNPGQTRSCAAIPNCFQVNTSIPDWGHVDATLDELLSTAFEAHLARISVQQNDDMRKISAGVGLVAMPTLIAGVYGMNFDHMPELGWQYGYPLSLALMVVASLGLWILFKKSGWL